MVVYKPEVCAVQTHRDARRGKHLIHSVAAYLMLRVNLLKELGLRVCISIYNNKQVPPDFKYIRFNLLCYFIFDLMPDNFQQA